MPDDQHSPTPGNRWQARRPAESYPDEQPPDHDGPEDEVQPEMNEPEPAASTPGGTQFPAVPEPPTGASANLKYILSVVHDPKNRQAIERFAYEYGDKREDHMLTAAAAMATAILETHIDRAKKLEAGLEMVVNLIAQRAGRMGTDAQPEYDLDMLQAVFRSEADQLAKDAFKGGIKTALACVAGGVIVGLFIAFLIHIL